MRGSVLGRRYAGALLDLGIKQGKAEAWGEELTRAVQILAAPDTLKALASPLYPAEFKKSLIDRAAAELKLSPAVANLLRFMLDKRRIGLILDALDSYREMLDEHTGRASATVTSAVPLDGAALARLRVLLQRKLGRRIELTAQTDPQVLGGLRLDISSKVYDATLSNHLARLRENMKHH